MGYQNALPFGSRGGRGGAPRLRNLRTRAYGRAFHASQHPLLKRCAISAVLSVRFIPKKNMSIMFGERQVISNSKIQHYLVKIFKFL